MFYILLSLLFLSTPLVATSENAVHREVTTAQLKSWYDQNKEMIIIDARTPKYFSGVLLPHAKWLPVDSNESEIQKALPTKNISIVIYCYSINCPLSGTLYDKLKDLGYSNIYEYREGLKEWINKGFPTDKQ